MLLLLLACAGPDAEPADPNRPESVSRDTSDAPENDSGGAGGSDDTAPEDLWSVTWGPIPADLAAEMQGTTMHDGCPVPMEDLVLMEPAHWDMDGAVQIGRLVVAEEHAADLAQALEAMFRAGFPIRSMEPASAYGGSDDASMAADNTSAFNCRAITGGSSWSQHSYGGALDINPLENPYVSGSTVLPPGGDAYTDRSDVRPGMVVEGDAVTAAFAAIGWGWGGDWSSLKDYQHFSWNSL